MAVPARRTGPARDSILGVANREEWRGDAVKEREVEIAMGR